MGPKNGSIQHLRILLYGPAGSGKSSFINSIGSVCQNRITSLAMASNCAQSFTVQFNPASTIDMYDGFYNRNPDTSDKVNILVCVLNANTAGMPAGFIAKMRNITMAARDCGIPQIAILTRINEAYPLVKNSVKNVYYSKFIKNPIEEYHGMLEIPLCAMFPVKNYHKEQDVEADIDMQKF